VPEWVLLATIRRARGIRGEVAAQPVGSPIERFTPGLRVSLVRDERAVRTVEIEHAWEREGVLVLKFAGLDTRNDAEELPGLEVCVPFEERRPAPEGEYYFADLIGCRVETPDGRVLGEVADVHEYGAAPLLEVREGNRELLVPFTEAFYKVVDVSGRRIVTEIPEGLEDLDRK